MTLTVPTPLHDHRALTEALSVHGALLPCELHELGVSPEQAVAEGVLVAVNSLIGPLYFPARRKRAARVDDELTIRGRTPSAAIDGAYLRLFIRRHAEWPWQIPSVHTLGLYHSDLSRMPHVTLKGKRHYVGGKVLGQGVTAQNLLRHVQALQPTLMREGAALLTVAPFVRRYRALSKQYPSITTFMQYTDQEAEEDNRKGQERPT